MKTNTLYSSRLSRELAFYFTFCLEVNKNTRITENLWRTFWRDKWRAVFDIVQNFRYKGQAHNIFSQILRIRICNFFLTNIMYHLFWFSQLFDQQEICFLFQKMRNIGKKDCRFVFWNFVKTYSVLDKRYDHGTQKTLFSKLDQSFTVHMEQKYR